MTLKPLALFMAALTLLLSACTSDAPPAGTPSPTQPAGSPTPPSDQNNFRGFVQQMDTALKALDVNFFMNNTAFQTIPCSQPAGPPSLPVACITNTGGTTDALLMGVLQSEGLYLDRAEYQTLIEGIMMYVETVPPDQYGPATPQIYAMTTLKPQFQTPSSGVERRAVLVSCTGCMTPGHPAKGAMPPRGRRVAFFEATYTGQKWQITALKMGVPRYLDPNDQLSKELFDTWTKWP